LRNVRERRSRRFDSLRGLRKLVHDAASGRLSDTREISDLRVCHRWHCVCNHASRIGHQDDGHLEDFMCGSVQNQPVYTPPPACPAPAPQQAPQAPKACTPPPCAPVDTFTPPPPPVVSPEKAPTIQSTPNADAPAACAKNEACAPERKGLMKMLGALFTAVFAFAAVFMSRRPDVANGDARHERNRNDSHACARDWRNFEGRARQRVVAPERDAVRPQTFTPPCTQRV
jgi:hypothetical protein